MCLLNVEFLLLNVEFLLLNTKIYDWLNIATNGLPQEDNMHFVPGEMTVKDEIKARGATC